MRKNIFQTYRLLVTSVLILTLVLIQFPAVSPAFNLGKFKQPNNNFIFSAKSDSGFSANSAASPLVVFSNATSITITDRDNNTNPNGTVGISSPYPSTIPVAGMSGTISDVNVTITGFNAARPRDIDIVLVAPTGQALTLMADTGDLTSTSPGVTITLDDAAANPVPTGTGSSIPSGTYKPTDFVFSATDRDDFPSPGPSSVNDPAPTGTATLASVFNGLNPNGNWNLFIIDDSLGGGNSTITGGWSINITTAGAVAATNTSVSSNTNPALTTQTVTFTSTTTQVSGGAAVTTGTVSFTQNGNAIAGCTNVAVNGSGNAACMTTLPEGTRTITATYNGTASFGQSNGGLSQVINSPTVVTGSQFCNNGGITINDGGSATVYPSNITVSGLFGTISNVQVLLNSLNAPRPSNLDFLLVGSGGQAFQMMSDVGDATTPAPNVSVTLADSAANPLPTNAPWSASGTFRPTDFNAVGETDVYPAPAPGSFSRPAPVGSATFSSAYGGSNPNGTWKLFAVDDGIGGGNSTVTGWCVNFTLAKFATTTTVTSSANPSVFGQPVTFTATVTSSAGTPTGNVEFFDGATSLGVVALNGSGEATKMTSSLSVGTHTITAQYLGANVGAGGGGFNTSGGSLTGGQVVNKANTSVGLSSSQNPSTAGQTVTFTATVSATSPGTGTPSGTIDFLNGGVVITGCDDVALSGGSATCMTSALTTGNHIITAQYSGNSNFNTSNGTLSGGQTVNAYIISGTVMYGTTPTGDPVKVVPGVTLNAAGTPAASTTTALNGTYALSGLGSGPYTVTPSKASQASPDNNGISLQDASEVAKYVFNQRTFTANQLIAADATGAGGVSIQDASEIAKRAFNITSTNIVGQWKFVPASRTYQSISANLTGENYDGILVGDVTGNWTPPSNRPESEEGEEISKEAAVKTEGETEALRSAYNEWLEGFSTPAKVLSEKANSSEEERNAGAVGGGVPVSLPNTSGNASTTVLIPVTVGNLTGLNVTAYDLTVTFDPLILKPAATPFEFAGTLTGTAGGYSGFVDTTTPSGTLRIGAFGTNPIVGSGTLIFLRFNVLPGAAATSQLNFQNFQFGEGTPADATINGSFMRLGPTAASASISGRLLSPFGKGLSKETIVLTDMQGQSRTAMTNSFGYYRFTNLMIGQSYTMEVRSKRYKFTPQVITINGDTDNLNFSAQ